MVRFVCACSHAWEMQVPVPWLGRPVCCLSSFARMVLCRDGALDAPPRLSAPPRSQAGIPAAVHAGAPRPLLPASGGGRLCCGQPGHGDTERPGGRAAARPAGASWRCRARGRAARGQRRRSGGGGSRRGRGRRCGALCGRGGAAAAGGWLPQRPGSPVHSVCRPATKLQACCFHRVFSESGCTPVFPTQPVGGMGSCYA